MIFRRRRFMEKFHERMPASLTTSLAAAVLLTNALAACSGTPPSTALRSGPASLSVADAALDAGVPDTALNVANGVLRRSPNDSDALVRQGEAYAALGQTNRAVDSFNKAIVIAPGAAPAHLGLARILLMRGDAVKAERELITALEKDPRDTRVLVNLGIARDLQGRHAEAQANYQQALTISPGLPAARINLGLSLALSGRGDEATAALRPLAAENGSSEAVRHDLAVALAVSGRKDEARAQIGTDLPSAEAKTTVEQYHELPDVVQ